MAIENELGSEISNVIERIKIILTEIVLSLTIIMIILVIIDGNKRR